MEQVIVNRIYQDDCVIGVMNYKGVRMFTLELPSKGNLPNISCIPEGKYICNKIVSPSLGECINVGNVPGRTYIRIHKGNYTSQIQGCILVGDSLKDINGDGIVDVANSKVAFDLLMEAVPSRFELVII